MKSVALLLSILLLVAAGPVQAQSKGITDFGEKEFTARDVLRALAPAPRTRGLSIGKDEAQEPQPAEKAQPADKGPRKLSLQLQFGLNSAELTPDAKHRLDVVAEALASAELANSNIIVSGHTDSSGGYDYNLRLSKRRADSVKTYLVSAHDIGPQRLKAVGRGPDEPIDEANPKSPANRRVQLAVAE
jgi:outer membrane protein OmpA-like peptidoglycan-associated protein